MNRTHTHKKKWKTMVPSRTTRDMVESAWENMGHFLHHLDPDIQKRSEKTWTSTNEDHKKKYSVVYKKKLFE